MKFNDQTKFNQLFTGSQNRRLLGAAAGLALALLLPGVAAADQVIATCSGFTTIASAANTILCGQFNPSLGTLDGFTVSGSATTESPSLTQNALVSSPIPSPESVSMSFSITFSGVTVGSANFAQVTVGNPTIPVNCMLIGSTYQCLASAPLTQAGVVGGTVTDPGLLAAATGASRWDVTLASSSLSNNPPCNGCTLSPIFQPFTNIELTYNYAVTTPEPGTLIAIPGIVALLAFGVRRRRSA